MNNTARSLKIVSIANGWDPDRIEGFPDRIDGTYTNREMPFDSDTGPIPAEASSPHMDHPQGSGGGGAQMSPNVGRETAKRGTNHANPYPGMPGSE
jgi:hypothetical protein